MIHAGPSRKSTASNKLSLLLSLALLAPPSQAVAQEFTNAAQEAGSGSRGTATATGLNPRSPLNMIRRSVRLQENRSAWAGNSKQDASAAPLPPVQTNEPNEAKSDSWALAALPPATTPHSLAPSSSLRSLNIATPGLSKQPKFDRRYLNFPHKGRNQVQKYPDTIPMTGTTSPGMAVFDKELCDFMRRWQIPGASISLVKNGKVLYCRGYGYADLENKKAVQTNSVFRIGSISKTLTSVAILKLAEQGKIGLSTPAIPLLRYQDNSLSKSRDPRINRITIQNLLQGTAGWDRSQNGDPMFMPLAQQAAQKYSNTLRPTPEAIIRFQLDKSLDFDPGSRFSYSNLGYSILGEIISKTSSTSYADYVKQEILAPLGIYSLQPGKTRVLAANEVCYYGYSGENSGPSIFPNIRSALPLEYGGDFCLESMTADCGWIGTTSDVAKFVSAVFGGTSRHPLHASTVRQMIARPQLTEGPGTYFAMGWEVDPPNYSKGMRIKKEGCLPGSTTLVLHRTDGSTCAIAFNTRPQLASVFQDETQKMVEKALNSCKTF